MDIVFLLLTALLGAACAGYLALCARLEERR
jgi:hypothetical protein